MNYLSRLDPKIQKDKMPMLTMALCVALAFCAPLAKASDSGVELLSVIDDTPAVLVHGSSGYLGVTIHDIDPGRVGELHVKDVRGAEVVMLDHDAPACKAGMRLHDVILQMNGQAIDNVEQLRKMLHATPVGRTVTFVLSRDGQPQTLNIELGDRAKLEQQPFMNPTDDSEPDSSQRAQNTNQTSPQHRSQGELFDPRIDSVFGTIQFNPLYTGARIEPVSPQQAGNFGIKSGRGLLVKTVYDDSPASAAGIKAGDIVLNVNGQPMVKLKDWTRAIRINRGKQVQVTVIRDHKEQTITMWAGSARNKG